MRRWFVAQHKLTLELKVIADDDFSDNAFDFVPFTPYDHPTREEADAELADLLERIDVADEFVTFSDGRDGSSREESTLWPTTSLVIVNS